ncbi:phosphoglycerate mutase-like protein [Mycena floridula]|nr:phosphoglycerate mutase-like protein [Mycena floridula]
MARIYIVRHGETNENNQRIIQGQLNTHLNDEGREQARLVADALKDVEFHAAYSSDLERASDTAKAILLHHPGVELVEQQELRERNMGDIQGRVYNHELFGTWLKAEANIESTAAFAARGLDWWVKHVVQKVPHGPYNVLVTSHGAFIGGLVKNLINSKKILCGNSVVIKTLDPIFGQ